MIIKGTLKTFVPICVLAIRNILPLGRNLVKNIPGLPFSPLKKKRQKTKPSTIYQQTIYFTWIALTEGHTFLLSPHKVDLLSRKLTSNTGGDKFGYAAVSIAAAEVAGSTAGADTAAPGRVTIVTVARPG